MKFFKAEDFEPILQVMHSLALDRTAELANAKLEREAKAVYGHYWGDLFMTIEQKDTLSTHTALVLNIQPIEKPKCEKHEPGNQYQFWHLKMHSLRSRVGCPVDSEGERVMENLTEQVMQLWDWQHGGTSFSCQLYALFQKADSENKARLAMAFPDHWKALLAWNDAGDNGNDLFRYYGVHNEESK